MWRTSGGIIVHIIGVPTTIVVDMGPTCAVCLSERTIQNSVMCTSRMAEGRKNLYGAATTMNIAVAMTAAGMVARHHIGVADSVIFYWLSLCFILFNSLTLAGFDITPALYKCLLIRLPVSWCSVTSRVKEDLIFLILNFIHFWLVPNFEMGNLPEDCKWHKTFFSKRFAELCSLYLLTFEYNIRLIAWNFESLWSNEVWYRGTSVMLWESSLSPHYKLFFFDILPEYSKLLYPIFPFVIKNLISENIAAWMLA